MQRITLRIAADHAICEGSASTARWTEAGLDAAGVVIARPVRRGPLRGGGTTVSSEGTGPVTGVRSRAHSVVAGKRNRAVLRTARAGGFNLRA